MKKLKMFSAVAVTFLLAVPMVASAETKGKSELNIAVASSRDVLDQPCYMGGKYAGNCSLSKPYYNILSGDCYSTLPACKEADGDLKNPVSSSCVRCGK